MNGFALLRFNQNVTISISMLNAVALLFALATSMTAWANGASPQLSRIAVANRGTNTVTLIDTESERKLHLELEAGSMPMYAQNPIGSDELWLGDRANDRVLVYDALRLRRIIDIPAGRGVFHMWSHPDLDQMWVVNDIEKTLTVISVSTKQVLATVPVPSDLRDGFKPHDVTLNANSAYISLLADDGSDGWLVKYNAETFKETARLQVPSDPHLFHWGMPDSLLYVAAQAGTVLAIDPQNLKVVGNLSIPGAHGIWADETETFLYVTDITSTDGTNSLYTIDIKSFTIVPGSPSTAALPFPHNVMVSIDNTKLFVTHSNPGSQFTTAYDLNASGLPVTSRVIETGAVPFGIMLIRDPAVDRLDITAD